MNEIQDQLRLGAFTIRKPYDWDPENIKLEIKEYDGDSTHIDMEDLKILHVYIGKILDEWKTKLP